MGSTETEIEAIKTSTQAILSESEEKVAQLTAECERLTKLSEDYKEQARGLDAKVAMQQLDMNKLQREHDLLQERNKALMQRYADLEATMAKQQADLVQAHQNEMNLVIEKSNTQIAALQKLFDQQKSHAEEERNKHMMEIDRQKTSHLKTKKDYELLQAVTVEKDLELTELKTQLTALRKETETLSSQLQNQEKYWNFFESNNQATKNILSELKEIPKTDFSSSCMNIMSDIKNNISFSNDHFIKVTEDLKQAIELFQNFSMNADKKE